MYGSTTVREPLKNWLLIVGSKPLNQVKKKNSMETVTGQRPNNTIDGMSNTTIIRRQSLQKKIALELGKTLVAEVTTVPANGPILQQLQKIRGGYLYSARRALLSETDF